MKFDAQLQHDVLAQLEWEPSIDASQIGVTAKNGVVTLTGTSPNYAQKLKAERVAKSVRGVVGVVNEIEVTIPDHSQRTDQEIAAIAIDALRWDACIPDDQIQVTVRNGWVLLHGNVEHYYQRAAAAADVSKLAGVRGVSNHIAVVSKVTPEGIRDQIQAAFKRHAEIDARNVLVDTYGGVVTLRGNVHTWAELDEAQNAAWSAPGVVDVKNELCVVP